MSNKVNVEIISAFLWICARKHILVFRHALPQDVTLNIRNNGTKTIKLNYGKIHF